MTERWGVFLDRDGTLIDDPGFLDDPDGVRLLAGAGRAVRRLNEAGVPVVVVTNQSGIGRGLISEEAYRRVAGRLAELLAAEGARLDASYHCPHIPDEGCECRKPGTLLYRRASADLGIDLSRSWWIGDRPSDLTPAREFGGSAVLVRTGEGRNTQADRADAIADGVDGAVSRVLEARHAS